MANTAEKPDTIPVPVSGYIRMPAPSKEEREEMIAELDAISEDIKQGNYIEFGPGELLAWLREDYENYLEGK